MGLRAKNTQFQCRGGFNNFVTIIYQQSFFSTHQESEINWLWRFAFKSGQTLLKNNHYSFYLEKYKFDFISRLSLTCDWIQGSINDVSKRRQNVQIPFQRNEKFFSKCVQVNDVIALVEVVRVGPFTHVRPVDVDLRVDGDYLETFHQHFTSRFCSDILSKKKIINPNCNQRKAAQNTFVQKSCS